MGDAPALLEALRRLGASLRPEKVLATLCAEAAAATGATAVIVFEGDAERGMQTVAVHGLPDELVGQRRGPGEGLCGLAARSGRAAFSDARDHAAVSVPLRRRGGEPDGALTACFDTARPVGEEEAEALEALVQLAGPALRNAEDHAAARRAATYDSLTGCLNHAAFESRLREEISRAERERGPLALALLDLDDFKSVNERDGHLAGDAVLRSVGALLREAVRLHDTVARFGGDEFTLLLPGTGLEGAGPVVDRAVAELRRAPVPGGRELGAAAGVAAWRPGETAIDVIERADLALREAKRARAAPTRRIHPSAEADHTERAAARERVRARATDAGVIEALAAALEARGAQPADRWVAERAVAVGRELGLAPKALDDVRLGAILHDIGKVAVPAAILDKPGPLTPAERRVIERHPLTGEQVLAGVASLEEVRRVVRHSHERWDGGGYPDALRGEDIPIGARIVFVVDAYRAMTADRPFRPGMAPEAAGAELEANAGRQFDPGVVEAALRIVGRRPV